MGILEIVRKIVKQQAITTLLQPIVDVERRCAWGYEALSRGPFYNTTKLINTAASAGILQEFENTCIRLALRNFKNTQLTGLLFINVSYETLSQQAAFDSFISSAMAECDLKPSQIVIELTEHTPSQDIDKLRDAVAYFQTKGFAIALDDLGSGYSSLQLWSNLKPDYIKFDRYFISNIDTDTVKQNFVSALIDIAQSQHCTVIAEGVETPGEAALLASMRIPLMQGYHFSYPQLHPKGLNLSCFPSAIKNPADGNQAAKLTSHTVSVSSNISFAELADIFRKNVAATSIAVLDGTVPVGIVNRRYWYETMNGQLAAETEISVTTLMDKNPLIVESCLRFDQVSNLIIRRPELTMNDDFIISHDGHFVGVGQVSGLLRSIATKPIKNDKLSQFE